MFRIRLKELRENAGLSQYKFADKFGVAQSTVGSWEAGKREPNFDTMQRLADFFNVSVDYLLGREDTKTPSPKDESVYVIKDEKAKIMLKWFESLPDHQQDLAIALLRSALDQVNQQKTDQ